MDPKPGIRTTEFWLTILGAAGAIAAAAANVFPGKYAALLIVVSTTAYKLSRGLAKISPPGSQATTAIYPIEPPGDGGTEAPPAPK